MQKTHVSIPAKPDTSGLPAPSRVRVQHTQQKYDLAHTPFIQRIREKADGEKQDLDKFSAKMSAALEESFGSDEERNKVIRTFESEESGTRWADGLIQAMPELKTGAAIHEMGEMGARDTRAASKMGSVSAKLNGLTAAQTKAFLQAVHENPQGFEPAAIIARIQTAK